jgi:hypothetical protein
MRRTALAAILLQLVIALSAFCVCPQMVGAAAGTQHGHCSGVADDAGSPPLPSDHAPACPHCTPSAELASAAAQSAAGVAALAPVSFPNESGRLIPPRFTLPLARAPFLFEVPVPNRVLAQTCILRI